MIDVLISLLVLVIVFGAAWWVIRSAPFPQPFRWLASAILVLIAIILLLDWFHPLVLPR
jgi:hypothetical protein